MNTQQAFEVLRGSINHGTNGQPSINAADLDALTTLERQNATLRRRLALAFVIATMFFSFSIICLVMLFGGSFRNFLTLVAAGGDQPFGLSNAAMLVVMFATAFYGCFGVVAVFGGRR